MKILDCMKRNVVSIPASTTLGQAAVIFVERHVGLLPVLDRDNKPIGVLGLQDLLKLTLPSFVQLIEDIDFVHERAGRLANGEGARMEIEGASS